MAVVHLQLFPAAALLAAVLLMAVLLMAVLLAARFHSVFASVATAQMGLFPRSSEAALLFARVLFEHSASLLRTRTELAASPWIKILKYTKEPNKTF
ncbi:MAG: hypothetical protein IKT52_02860 [Oscillospiraceae bacterium]|nr:hypothetical protein [Oscillospiraceae bacterium]